MMCRPSSKSYSSKCFNYNLYQERLQVLFVQVPGLHPAAYPTAIYHAPSRIRNLAECSRESDTEWMVRQKSRTNRRMGKNEQTARWRSPSLALLHNCYRIWSWLFYVFDFVTALADIGDAGWHTHMFVYCSSAMVFGDVHMQLWKRCHLWSRWLGNIPNAI